MAAALLQDGVDPQAASNHSPGRSGAPDGLAPASYYDALKDWARAGVVAQPRQQVLVYNKDRITIVLPNKEIDLGVVGAGSRIMVRETWRERGSLRELDWDAYIEKPVASRHRIPLPVEA
jgi:hypothetical protein